MTQDAHQADLVRWESIEALDKKRADQPMLFRTDEDDNSYGADAQMEVALKEVEQVLIDGAGYPDYDSDKLQSGGYGS